MFSDSNFDKRGIPTLDKIVASATRIRFPAGAFGKTFMLVAIFALACAAIAWAARDPYVSALALIILGFVALYALGRAFNFADKNPSAAILEGAEFLKHEQIKLAAKGIPRIPHSESIQTDEPEDFPLMEDPTQANTPDDSTTDTEEQAS